MSFLKAITFYISLETGYHPQLFALTSALGLGHTMVSWPLLIFWNQSSWIWRGSRRRMLRMLGMSKQLSKRSCCAFVCCVVEYMSHCLSCFLLCGRVIYGIVVQLIFMFATKITCQIIRVILTQHELWPMTITHSSCDVALKSNTECLTQNTWPLHANCDAVLKNNSYNTGHLPRTLNHHMRKSNNWQQVKSSCHSGHAQEQHRPSHCLPMGHCITIHSRRTQL
jgi:hypothetical protein